MDRYPPRLIQHQSALPDAWRFAQRLLLLAQPVIEPTVQTDSGLGGEVWAINRTNRSRYGRLRIVALLRPLYKRPYRVTTNSAYSLPVAIYVLDRRFDG